MVWQLGIEALEATPQYRFWKGLKLFGDKGYQAAKDELAFIEIIINVIFGIVIYREGPTRPPVRIIIVVDEAKGPIIMERRIVVVVVKVVFVFGIIFVVIFEIVIVVVVVIV